MPSDVPNLEVPSSTPVPPAVLPPIISVADLAATLDRSCAALYHWPRDGKLHGAARRRGKRWLIWRDRALGLQEGQSFSVGANGSIRLTEKEISAAFESWPHPVARCLYFSPQTLAILLGVGRSTVYRWLELRRLEGTYTRRSDGVRFRRKDILLALFNGDDWNEII